MSWYNEHFLTHGHTGSVFICYCTMIELFFGFLSIVGTIFLWLFWPSFNAGLAEGDAQHRAVINTYYSLAACCVTAFAVSALVSKEQTFDMVYKRERGR